MSTTNNTTLGSNLGMAAQLASQSLRFGWYFALQRLMDRRTEQIGGARPKVPPDAAGALDAGAAGRPRPPSGGRCAGRARRHLPGDG